MQIRAFTSFRNPLKSVLNQPANEDTFTANSWLQQLFLWGKGDKPVAEAKFNTFLV